MKCKMDFHKCVNHAKKRSRGRGIRTNLKKPLNHRCFVGFYTKTHPKSQKIECPIYAVCGMLYKKMQDEMQDDCAQVNFLSNRDPFSAGPLKRKETKRKNDSKLFNVGLCAVVSTYPTGRNFHPVFRHCLAGDTCSLVQNRVAVIVKFAVLLSVLGEAVVFYL